MGKNEILIGKDVFFEWHELIEKEWSNVYTYVSAYPVKVSTLDVTVDIFIAVMINNLYATDGKGKVNLMGFAKVLATDYCKRFMPLETHEAINRILKHSVRIDKFLLKDREMGKETLINYHQLVYRKGFESLYVPKYCNDSQAKRIENILGIVFSGVKALLKKD